METRKVLLVEDDPGDARLVGEALAGAVSSHFDVDHVTRLSDGCDRLTREEYAAMLLDLSLPDSHGLDTVRRARAAADDLPIIVLTGDADQSLAIASLAEGAQDYLVKGDLSGVPRAIHYAVERSRLEARLRDAHRLQAIGQVAGGIAHQFNNIMTAVLGYSELLLAERDTDDARRGAIEEIVRGARRAMSLTDQLLAVGRRQHLAPRTLDLSETLQSMTPMLRGIAGDGIAIHVRPAVTPFVVFDAGRLEQAIATLTIYARDRMADRGTMTFDLSTVASVDGDAPYVLLTVGDTADAIDERTRAHLFEPFYDLEDLAKRRLTGLELPSIRGLMEQAGGRFEFSSDSTGGNRFQMYFRTAIAR